MVLGAHIQLHVTAGVFGKNPHLTKMTKNSQKWPKNRVFGQFNKIMSLLLSGICVKRKFLWFINILRKLHPWEKSGSQITAKNCSRPVRFQYSLIIDNSRLMNKFSDKNSHLGKRATLGSKIVHPHNSGSAGRIFLTFCTMKVANRQMRVILLIFKKKI